MKTLKSVISLIVMLLIGVAPAMAGTAGDGQPTVKKERNHIRAGNKLYKAKRYAEAEVEYRKALQEAPSSSIAQFNLATALMRQGNATASQESKDNPMNEAQSILSELAQHSPSRDIRGKASYDLGNIAYAQQQWNQAIEHYKNALRCNPDDDQARDNLRLAQLKKQQQDKQNKDKNKDQNNNQDKQDQNKDQNKDKDKQDQNKDQNQEKDKQDQNKEQNQDQNKNQQEQNKDQQNGQQQQSKGMSQQNADQVLKAMQDQERATQQRINARRAQQQKGERVRTNRKW